MYRRPKFLELLLEIRREMALEADYDVDLFVGIVRKGSASVNGTGKVFTESAAKLKDTGTDIPTILKRTRKVRKG